MALQIDLRQVVLLIARAIDLVGVDDVLHGRRVAILAVECAKNLGWSESEQQMLFDAALLHDIGVSSTRLHCRLVNELDWAGASLHGERGYELLKDFSPLAHLAPIVRYHHTHWQDLQRDNIDPDIARFTNLIYLADRIDVSAHPYYTDNSLLLHVQEICARINRYRGTFFAPELVDAFLAAAQAEAFWLILDNDFIPQYVNDINRSADKAQIGLDNLKQLGSIVAAVVDAKSHFTSEHSHGVARVARFMGEEFGLRGEHLDRLEVAALLHDIGKLQIPDEVLESPLKLTPYERAIMKKHSFATYQILKRVIGLEEVARWASQHHESLDGGGYPFHALAGELPLESRIIKVADIYQALAQNRPYRQPLPPPEILQLLRQMERDLEIDPQLVDFVASHLDGCQSAAVGH
ncbi:MAG: phosphodiesterase [Deltaproteobacteria bacterium HGW-Deltaproteobacteria-4]|nr:MAG: phosphodiesterase [Deltaproteobacteria bacterium HGW-Deltaproteobacteria-4]